MSSDDAAPPVLHASLWPAFVDRLADFARQGCREAVLALNVESGSFSHWLTYAGEPAPADFDALDFFDDAWELIDPLQDALGVHEALVMIRAGAAVLERDGARGRVDTFEAPAGVELGLAAPQVQVRDVKDLHRRARPSGCRPRGDRPNGRLLARTSRPMTTYRGP